MFLESNIGWKWLLKIVGEFTVNSRAKLDLCKFCFKAHKWRDINLVYYSIYNWITDNYNKQGEQHHYSWWRFFVLLLQAYLSPSISLTLSVGRFCSMTTFSFTPLRVPHKSIWPSVVGYSHYFFQFYRNCFLRVYRYLLFCLI